MRKSLDSSESLAADYALGVLEGNDHQAVEQRIACDGQFAELVSRWQIKLASMAEPAESVQPPSDLFSKIEAQIDDLSRPLPDSMTLRSGDGEWTPMARGVDRKILWRDEENGRETILFRMAPGARYRPHRHKDNEECYLISGDVAFGDHKLRAGDFHVAFPGSKHPVATTQNGCLVLISSAA